MAKKMKQLLFIQAKKAGSTKTGGTPIARVWTKATRTSAQTWMRTQAPDKTWEKALQTLAKTCKGTATGGITAERIALIAQQEDAVLREIQEVEPWLGAKVAKQAPQEILEKPAQEWKRWCVNREREGLDEEPLNAEQTEETLRTWRWKHTEPPLIMIALCYETGPFVEDNAWANAIDGQGKENQKRWIERAQTVGAHQAGLEFRKRELKRADQIRTVIEKHAEWARQDLDLKRAKKAWAKNKVLEGDGETREPYLEEERYGKVVWYIPITGPETLLAAASIGGLKPSTEIIVTRNIRLNTDQFASHAGRRIVDRKKGEKDTLTQAVRSVLGWEIAEREVDPIHEKENGRGRKEPEKTHDKTNLLDSQRRDMVQRLQ